MIHFSVSEAIGIVNSSGGKHIVVYRPGSVLSKTYSQTTTLAVFLRADLPLQL